MSNQTVVTLWQRLHRLSAGEGLRARLVRGGAGSIVIKGLNALLGFALAVALARMLGAEGYGVYAFAFALLTLLAMPAQAGLPQLVVRETAKARQAEEWELMRGLWRWAARFVGLFSALIVLLVLLVLLVLGWSGGWIESARTEVLLIGLPLVPLIALGLGVGGALRGLGRVVVGQLPDSVLRPAVLLLLVALCAALPSLENGRITAQLAMFLHIVAASVAFAVGLILLWRRRPKELTVGSSSRQTPVQWRRAAWPLALVAGFQLINAQVDILLLGLMRENAEVGIYRVVTQMGTLIVFGLVAINQVLHPHFASLYAVGDRQRLQRLVTTSARVILIFASVPVLVFIIAPGPLLSLIFGEEYAAGAVALSILALGQLANAAFGSVGALLNMTGHERDTMRGMAVALVVNVVLNLTLIPPFGMMGAATATAASFVVWNAVLWRYVWVRLGIESTGLPLRRAA